LTIGGARDIYLVVGPTDMRQSFNGLSAIVANALKKDVRDGQLFMFSNRRRNRLKILFWDRGGLWVCAKRLEKGTLAWPKNGRSSLELSPEELTMLLGGIDRKDIRRRRWYRPLIHS
jgi:transposase